jgi:hypothetical protein
MAGRCAICDHRLPSIKIALYIARVSHWQQGMADAEERDVEVAVCSDECLHRFEVGDIPA